MKQDNFKINLKWWVCWTDTTSDYSNSAVQLGSSTTYIDINNPPKWTIISNTN